MKTDNTLPTQLRLAAEIIEKNLPWEFETSGGWMVGYESDISAFWEGNTRLAQPAPAEPTPFDLNAHVIANGFRPLAEGESFHRQDWTADMLPMRTRPLLLGEIANITDDELVFPDGRTESPSITPRHEKKFHTRTHRLSQFFLFLRIPVTKLLRLRRVHPVKALITNSPDADLVGAGFALLVLVVHRVASLLQGSQAFASHLPVSGMERLICQHSDIISSNVTLS